MRLQLQRAEQHRGEDDEHEDAERAAREDEQAADVRDAVLDAPELPVGGDRPALDGVVRVALRDDAVDAGLLADAAHAVRDHAPGRLRDPGR